MRVKNAAISAAVRSGSSRCGKCPTAGKRARSRSEKVSDIGPAAFARRADQGWRHLQLMEGLVPDIVEPIGLRHARPDAGIDEVKEKQSGHALRCCSRHRLHQGATDVMADDADLPHAERSISANMSAACWSGPNGPMGLSLSPNPRRSGANTV